VSQLYGVDAGSIDSFFRGFDLEQHCQANDPPHPGDVELRHVFERNFGRRPSEPSRVFWFHLTRAPAGATFSEGILPLTASLAKFWDTVLNVFGGTVHETRLRELRRTGVPAFQYNHKVNDPLHAGPYAMLVRGIASKAEEVGNHDYLRLPEIMEDICTGYQERYGVSLDEALSASLLPTVVKFWSTKDPGDGCIDAALYYLYRTSRNEPLSMYANTCFDGENRAVPSEQIVSVEQPAA